MVKKIVLTGLLVAGAHADIDYQGTSLGVQASLFGAGAGIKAKLGDYYGIRASFDTFSYKDYEAESETRKYNLDLKLQDMMLIGAYHPWAGAFNLQGGVIVNNSALDGEVTPNARGADRIEFDFKNKHYSYAISELGAIDTRVDFDPVAPYVGFGWDTSFDKKKGFGFIFNVGVAYQGSATASYRLKYGPALDIDRRIATEAADIPDGPQKEAKIKEITDEVNTRKEQIEADLKKDIDAEMLSLQEELDKYQWIPYVGIGFNYKF